MMQQTQKQYSAEINRINPNEIRQKHRKGVSHHCLLLAVSKAGRGLGHFRGEKGRLQVFPNWRLWAWGRWRALTRSGASYVIG